MKRFSIVIIAALALTLLGGPVSAAPADKSTGGVGYITQNGFPAKVSFTAQGTPTDAKGQVNFRVDGLPDVKGTVTCYQRINDNTARFSGVVDRSDDPSLESFRITVMDNGTPGGAGDLITVVRNGPNTQDCTVGAMSMQPVMNGNLVVHHR